jgi:hypothetical protein
MKPQVFTEYKKRKMPSLTHPDTLDPLHSKWALTRTLVCAGLLTSGGLGVPRSTELPPHDDGDAAGPDDDSVEEVPLGRPAELAQ